MSHVIIGIHGLSNKPEKTELADWWEKAIVEGLEKNEGLDSPTINFSSVYWADIMYPDGHDENPDKYKEAAAGALKPYHEGLRDRLREKASDLSENFLATAKQDYGLDDAADAVLKYKLPDLSKYYQDPDIREKLRGRLRNRILQHEGAKIMVLSHSMGTIIAYDVLKELDQDHAHVSIEQFVTLGSPLGLSHVKYKIFQENSRISTPEVARNWSNFADKRDPVAFDTNLSGDFEASSRGIRVKDDLIFNDWEKPYHKSYGYLRAPEVSKLIKDFI